MTRDGLDPRLHGIEYAAIQYDKDKLVFIIDIPRSLQAPHMIVFKNDSKFFKRTNSGKYQMDVMEIKEACYEQAAGRKVQKTLEKPA